MPPSLRCSLCLVLALLGIGLLTAGRRPLHAQQAPPGTDAQAGSLAQQVRAGGDGALPALQTALAQAGIATLDANGTPVLTVATPSHGLAFATWEAQSLLTAESAGFRQPLDGAGAALAAADPLLDGQPLGAWLLDGVQHAAQGPAGALRFWGQFLAALGRQADGSNDLLTTSDPAAVTLDAVQLGLLTQRLAGDLYAFGRANEPAAMSWASARQATPNAPCTMGSVEGTIFDASALGYSVGFGKLLEYLEEQGLSAAGSFARFSGIANLVLSYAKLAWALDAFHAAIEMDGGPPLVRTKKQRPQTGELRQLRATLTMDTGNSQILNCLRPMLNAVGLDFSVPQNGAISGAELHWRPGAGFGQGIDLSGRIVEYNGDTQNQVTDANGQGRIGVEGFGQEQELSDSALPVMKQASVTLESVIQPANLIQDLISATSVASGGPLGILQIPAEMLARSSVAFSAGYSFPVKDWQEPRFRADGTFDYHFANSSTGVDVGAAYSGTFSVEFTVQANGAIAAHGSATVTFSSHWLYTTHTNCNQPSTTEDTTFELTGSAANQTLNLVFTPDGSLPSCSANQNAPGPDTMHGFPLLPVSLPEQDGATAQVPNAPQAAGYGGSFHVELTLLPPEKP